MPGVCLEKRVRKEQGFVKTYPFTVSPSKNALDLVIPRRSFYKGFVKICFTTRNKKQQLEIVKKKTRVLSIHVLLSTTLFETTRESTSCLTTLIQNVTENHNIIKFEDSWLL